ncbi:DUF4011 domain-containing protein [Brevibacterium linens]|uniref:Restriction endonuclease type II-like domain-containing protein n=1 Tax=Brevibacterium linens ATCC 9172 TaxID=1255617 RepID=A0A2H1KPG1_BRELN|nr:DUF4011 domain-containing protein [Brevibacterium linens]KAB1942593.1 DUF4011 domain-containing protein [Brevibacterium linens ATCC 9172]SMY01695.1 Protein of unknown function (DUF4011) [Brevibacterium linens ATCC 9172]
MSDSVRDEQFPELGDVFAEWKKQAAHLGGRDTMLHFRDSRDGSIDLSGAHPSGLAQLLAGRATRLSSLIRDHDILTDARRRAKSIRSKAEQLDNERGIRTAHLAIGFASWTEKDAKYKFNAPVVMRHITLVPRGSRVEDYEIVLDNEITINPALVQHLHAEYDLEVPVDDWVDATGGPHGFDPGPALDRLRDLGQSVPGLRINHRLIISTFANIASPFSTDYLPTQHPVLRALAGDEDVRASLGGPSYVPQPGVLPDEKIAAAEEAEKKRAEAKRAADAVDETEADGASDAAESQTKSAPEAKSTDTAKAEADDSIAEASSDTAGMSAGESATGGESAAGDEKAGADDEKAGEKTSADADAGAAAGTVPAGGNDDDEDYGQPTVPITDEPLDVAKPRTGTEAASAEPASAEAAGDKAAGGKTAGDTSADGEEPSTTDAEETSSTDAEADSAVESDKSAPAIDAAAAATPDAAATTPDAEGTADLGSETSEPGSAADGETPPASATGGDGEDVVPAALQEPITPLPDRKPQEEFLVIDVDGDQQAVVDAAVSGHSVVVDTPPGTGATQVAVAVATTLAHTGKSVLFLAQTSDALDDFSARLGEVGLSDFAVDTRAGTEDIRKQLIGLIGSAEKSERPDLSRLLTELNEQRATLADHVSSLHRRREPWDVSVYETMQHLAELTSGDNSPQTPVRFDDDILGASDDRRNILRGKLGELARLGAFTLDVEDTVWFGADLKSVEEAEAARTVAERIGRMIPDLVAATEPVLQKAKLNPRRNIDDWSRAIRVLLRVRKTLDNFAPDIYDHRLDDLIAATGTPEYRVEVGVEMGMMQRRRLKKSAAEFLRPGAEVTDLHEALIDVRAQRVILSDLAGHDGRPQIPRGVLEADEILQSVEADMAKLAPILETTPDGGDLGSMLIEELQARAEAMGSDSENLAELPERSRLQRELDGEGLSDLMADLRRRKVDESLVGPEFDLAYWASVLQTMAGEDPAIGRHDGDALHQVAEGFRENDRAFVAAGASRLRYNHAQAWTRGIDSDPIAAGVIKQELLSQHTSVNRISTQAPELLTTLAPVWMGSPYAVPELFSALPLFDAVVIADAGRLSVADVVPGITRARQVISLGDSRLLGPRPFSVAVDRFGMDDGKHPRSVQDRLGEFLPRMRLSNSYRLSPVGLIDLANRHFYDSTISTLPTAHTGEGSGLEFSYVADGRGPTDIGTGRVESPDAEVKRVVDLVLKHARNRSRESLAVVALTPHHAQRVATAISRAMKDLPYVAAFFNDSTKEPFVVTDAERVQGMSRDAVIFTLGFGRTVHGRVIHDFGPLSGPDGRRILAATMTRARKRLTLVSSIEAEDFDRSKLNGGAVMLPRLLEEIATGGVHQPGPHGEIYDPLMGDIADRLLQLGVVAHEHYNGIDLAVANSAEDEHGMIIAVAGDGPEYASMRSLRQRDRVLPEQLSRRGWKFMRVWSTDAFVDPQTETEKIFEAWRATVETMSPQAVLNAARAASVVVGRTGSRPKLVPGLPMHKYSAEGLDQMIDWIQSDAVVRGDGEIKDLLRTALAQKGNSSRGDSQLQAAVDRYRERHAQAKKVTGAEVFIPRSNSAGPVEDDILPTFDTGKIRADELRSAGLVQTASNDQVPEAADDSASTESVGAGPDGTDDNGADSAEDERGGAASAKSGAKNDDA